MNFIEKCSNLRSTYKKNNDGEPRQLVLANIVGAAFYNFGANMQDFPTGVPIPMTCTRRDKEFNELFKQVMKDLGYNPRKIKILNDLDVLNLFVFELKP